MHVWLFVCVCVCAHVVCLQATPSSEEKADEEGKRSAKRQRVTKVPKGAAPSADSEAMAAVQALSKVKGVCVCACVCVCIRGMFERSRH